MKLDSKNDFSRAYQDYSQAIYRFLYWQTRDSNLAQDLTSSTFERAWRSRKSFIGDHVQAWLYRIARNLLTDHWRKKKELLIDDVPELTQPIADDTAPHDFDLDQRIWQLGKSLDVLAEDLRAIVVLRFIDGLSARQVGEILGVSEGNVRIMQFRALKKLRKVLEDDK